MSDQKDKKELAKYQKSEPVQLKLFELIDQGLEKYSNTIELYDVMPKYNHGGVKREKSKLMEGLPILSREFVHRGKRYKLNISPAAIVDKSGKTIHYYLSSREELVEDVIRKLATKRKGVFLDGQAGALFTYYEVQKELSKINHGYNINEIKLAIDICSKTVIEIKSLDGSDISIVSNVFPISVTQTTEMEGKVGVTFHPLVTKSIIEGTYRLIDSEKVLTLKMALARWLYKRMSHLFSQANVDNPYQIKLSTIVRDSGMKEYRTISERIRQVEKAIKELKSCKAISKYEISKEFEKNKILNATFSLYVSESFVADVKKANKVANLRLQHTESKEVVDLDEIREEIEKSLYGLSKTVINNVLAKIKTKQELDELKMALMAAKEYIESKPNCIPAAITKSAIKDSWKPRNAHKDKIQREIVFEGEIQEEEKIIITPEQIKSWNKIVKALKNDFGKEIFDKWLDAEKLSLYSINNDEIVIAATSKFIRDFIKRDMLEQGGKSGIGIKGIVFKELPEIKKVIIIYQEPQDN